MYMKRPREHTQLNSFKPNDRRSIKRRHLIYYLRVWRLDDNTPLGQVIDINAQGMMLIGERLIPTGEKLDLKVHFPNTKDELKSMNFKAICRWSDKDINTAFYDSGFEFIEQSKEKIEKLQGLITDYGFTD